MTALKQPNLEINTTPKMLELASEMHKKDLAEVKEQYAEVIKSLEAQFAEVKSTTNASDVIVKDLSQQNTELKNILQYKEKEIDKIVKEHDEKVKKLEEEKKRIKVAIELDTEMKLANIAQIMERQKEEDSKSLERVKTECERSLNDIKYLHEQEKNSLESRLEKATQELKSLQSTKESSANNSVVIRDMQNNYLLEIQELNAHLDAFKKQSYEELACLKKQRDDAYKKVESLLASNPKAAGTNSTPNTSISSATGTSKSSRSSKIGMMKSKGKCTAAAEFAEGTQKEMTKLKKQNNDLKSYITKLETSEKKLKTMMAQKENTGTTAEVAAKLTTSATKQANIMSPGGKVKKTSHKPATARVEKASEQEEITELNAATLSFAPLSQQDCASEAAKVTEGSKTVECSQPKAEQE